MTKNVGLIDKVVRIIIALVTAYFAYTKEFETAWLIYVLWAVAIIMLLTALTSRCPLFSIFGISTCKVKK
jgi:low affinity Fe/Cu permease